MCRHSLTLGLAPWNTHSMGTFVRRDLGRFPPVLTQKGLVLEPEDFDLERAAALDHLPFAVGAKAP